MGFAELAPEPLGEGGGLAEAIAKTLIILYRPEVCDGLLHKLRACGEAAISSMGWSCLLVLSHPRLLWPSVIGLLSVA
jgi:hypothetical protein